MLLCSVQWLEELRPELTQPERRRLEFEVIQSVSRACIPDHLVIQNKVEVFIGICFYQMIFVSLFRGIQNFQIPHQFASANGYMMLYFVLV